MKPLYMLILFEDTVKGLRIPQDHYRIIALSNGDLQFLEHLNTNNLDVDFDTIISVETIGTFKPHPSVYRAAARTLNVESGETMIIASHSLNLLGARARGYSGAYINRYSLPYEGTLLQRDIITDDPVDFACLMVPGVDS